MFYDPNPQGLVVFYTYLINLLSGTVRPKLNQVILFHLREQEPKHDNKIH